MAWQHFLMALGLVFVLEGILPFASPDKWRRMMQTMGRQTNHGLRVMGLMSMLIGVVIVTVVHQFLF